MKKIETTHSKRLHSRLEYFVAEWLIPVAFLPIVLISLLLPTAARAQAISVYNGDFSIATNAASHGGALGEFDGLYGTGTNGWSVDTNAIAGLILSPTVAITSGVSGNASATGLLSATVPIVGTVVNNNFTIYNNNVTAGTASAGTTFIPGRVYTVTADFSSSTALNLSLLTGGGIGIGIRSSGTGVASSLGNSSDISLLSGTSGKLTLTYTATAGDAGNSIGITLFAGQSTGAGLAGLSALGNFSFDNVSLSVAPIPEPATWAAFAGSAILGGTLVRRRFTARKSAA